MQIECIFQIQKFCLYPQHIRACLGKAQGTKSGGNQVCCSHLKEESWVQPQHAQLGAQWGPCWCSPAAPAEPIAPCSSVHLRGHDLAVNCPQQQHKAQGSHHFTGTHNRHHEVQHHCYDWKWGKAKIKESVSTIYFYSTLLYCYLISAIVIVVLYCCYCIVI